MESLKDFVYNIKNIDKHLHYIITLVEESKASKLEKYEMIEEIQKIIGE